MKCSQKAMSLEGKVNLFSPDHISLLIHRTFNISIPRSHIPDDEYEFEHGPAKNDPEFGAAAGSSNYTDDVAMMEVDETGDVPGKEAWLNVENTEAMIESVGRWVNRATGEKVGKVDRTVRFTVVGCVIFLGYGYKYSLTLLFLVWKSTGQHDVSQSDDIPYRLTAA